MRMQTREDDQLLPQEQSSPPPSPPTQDQGYREVDIGEPYPGQASSSSTTGTPEADRGGTQAP